MDKSALTPTERKVAIQIQTLDFMHTLASSFSYRAQIAVRYRLTVDLGGGTHAGRLSMLFGRVAAGQHLSNLLLAPLVGSLSDTFGRLPFRYLEVVAYSLFYLHLTITADVVSYQLGFFLLTGVLSAGSKTVQQAALDDMFGSRRDRQRARWGHAAR